MRWGGGPGFALALALALAPCAALAEAEGPPFPPEDARALAPAAAAPEPGDFSQTDAVLDRAWQLFGDWLDLRAHDPAAAAGIAAQMQDLLSAEEVRIEGLAGRQSRQMEFFLSESTYMGEVAWDPFVALTRAEAAARIERMHIARSDYFRSYGPDGRTSDVLGRSTRAIGWAVTYAFGIEGHLRSLGDHDGAMGAFLWAFDLAQMYLVGSASQAVTRQLRLERGLEGWTAQEIATVHARRDVIEDVLRLEALAAAVERAGDPDEAARLRAEAAAARAGIDADLARLAGRGLVLADAILPRPVGALEMLDVLAPDEALLIVVRDSLFYSVILMTARDFRVYRTTSDAETLRGQTDRLLSLLSPPSVRGAEVLEGPGPPPRRDEVRALAHGLYLDIMAPAETALTGVTTVYVVATDSLARLPFGVLLSGAAAPDAADEELDWLVRRHAFLSLPSVELLLHRPGRSETVAPVYVGFGAADYGALLSDGSQSDVAAFAPLPESEGEVEAVAALFPSAKVLLAGRATEAAVQDLSDRGTFAQGGVLHFASHGAAAGEFGEDTEAFVALTPDDWGAPEPDFGLAAWQRVLPDGRLEAFEIRNLSLPADLVILSACNSAHDPDPLGGVGGLAAAFLDAGARRVMASHWPVNSRAAVEIVTAMMAADPGLDNPARALQGAMLGLIAEGGRRADPAYWAPFSIVGAP